MLLPAAVLLLVELSLRLGGYGYPTSFFKETEIAGQKSVINNEQFSLRFFPPELARWPTSFRFPVNKTPQTCRIFVFGESAAMGDPQPAYSASRYLEVMLRHRFPSRQFEVINLGITAINSHVILPIARESARRDGDLWIVYMGNNEMVGPFGAATVFGTRAPPRAAVRLNLAVQRTRTGQLLVSWLRNLVGKPRNTSWGGMQMFIDNQIPPDDPRKETVYRNFGANLRDIIATGLDAGARIVLCTVSVNLRDCPPFASMVNSNLPASDQERFERLMTDGKAMQEQGKYAPALELFQAAAKVDPQFAETSYREAQCRLQLADPEARALFQVSLDADALPFRADSRINGIIREVAGQHTNDSLVLCDAENSLMRADPSGVAGNESFFEHVHFNFAGNYRLARAWAQAVEPLLSSSSAQTSTNDWPSQKFCDSELGLTPWNRHFVAQSVIRRMNQPPLSTQFNNAGRQRAVIAEDEDYARQQKAPGAAARAESEFQRLIRDRPDDPFLHEGLANFYEATGNGALAVESYRRMVELLPDDFYSNLQLGRLLGELGRPADGEPFLKNATRLRPSLADGWHELGAVLSAQKKFAQALPCMQRAEQIKPDDPANVCYSGKVLGKLGRRAEAMAKYRSAIQMRPTFWEARFELANELAYDNQIAEAMAEFGEVLKLNPKHAVSHINLGTLFARVNRVDEAIAQFELALRIEPDNSTARQYLSQMQARFPLMRR